MRESLSPRHRGVLTEIEIKQLQGLWRQCLPLTRCELSYGSYLCCYPDLIVLQQTDSLNHTRSFHCAEQLDSNKTGLSRITDNITPLHTQSDLLKPGFVDADQVRDSPMIRIVSGHHSCSPGRTGGGLKSCMVMQSKRGYLNQDPGTNSVDHNPNQLLR